MELISLAKEAFQSVAEHAASYRFGQTALRYFDRTLWVVEKCARWAVPPPLDQDERPQPELVRPLPWLFFLVMLVTLRVIRESISLVNLVMGKPPLRSADVVMYIQSKRRYLRTLKYQGNRVLRARSTTNAQSTQSWSQAIRSLFEFTMCFRRQSPHYGNNNTTSVSNNDEVLVVKRSKRGREHSSPVASTSETTMERLIEKMMVDLDTDSDDDSSFTLTNVTSVKSDRSDFTADSDQDDTVHNNTADKNDNSSELQYTSENTPDSEHTGNLSNTSELQNIDYTPKAKEAGSTPNKTEFQITGNALKSQLVEHTSKNQQTGHKPKECEHNRNTSHTPQSLHIKNTHNTSGSPCSDLNEQLNSTPEKSRLAIFLAAEAMPPEEISKEEPKRPNDTSPSKIPRTPIIEQKIGTKFKIWSNKLKEKFSKTKHEGVYGTKSTEKDRRSAETHVEISSNTTL